MFGALVSNLRHEIGIVRQAVRINESLRSTFSNPLLNVNIEPLIVGIQKALPDITDWRIYDHCASITRLYSIYEGFVDDLLTDWLTLVPSLIQNYAQLDSGIKKTHRQGVGQLLQDLDQKRYRHIQPQQILQGLYYGLSGQNPYELFPEAFLKHSQNLRKEILEGLFARSGISGCWHWVETYQGVQDFITNVRGNSNTPEAELQELLNYRNEASHNYAITNVLTPNAILEKADFLEAVCLALVELVTNRILEYRIQLAQARQVGTITEVYKRSGAVVAMMSNIQLFVGQELYITSPAMCHMVRVESIQINDVPVDNFTIGMDIDVGLKLGELPKKNSRLFQV
jgi:hypothetical protein